MITGKIEFRDCHTLSDVVFAVEEASKRIEAGNVMGFDHNETGGFYFELSGDEEEAVDEADHPRGRCDTCGAPCDDETGDCTVDATHVVAIA